LIMVSIALVSSLSCGKFLDVVPDNVSTIDNAFTLKNEGEKFLFTLYSFLPKDGDGWFNAGLTSGDEIWYPQNDEQNWHALFRIALGQQNVADPYFNVWRGTRAGNAGDTRFQ